MAIVLYRNGCVRFFFILFLENLKFVLCSRVVYSRKHQHRGGGGGFFFFLGRGCGSFGFIEFTPLYSHKSLSRLRPRRHYIKNVSLPPIKFDLSCHWDWLCRVICYQKTEANKNHFSKRVTDQKTEKKNGSINLCR